MNRHATLTWRLPELMRAHNHMTGPELSRALRSDGGYPLSASHVNRMLNKPPERLQMALVGALCRILACSPNELLGYAVPSSSEVNRPIMTAMREATRKMAISGAIPTAPDLPAQMPRLTDEARAVIVGPRLRALKSHPLAGDKKE